MSFRAVELKQLVYDPLVKTVELKPISLLYVLYVF